MNIFDCKTYQEDLPLFKQLSFEPFNISTHTDHYIGKFQYEDGSFIKLSVIGFPAQFWTAKIFCSETKKHYEVSTGSGSLNDYWNTFDKIAQNMVVINDLS